MRGSQGISVPKWPPRAGWGTTVSSSTSSASRFFYAQDRVTIIEVVPLGYEDDAHLTSPSFWPRYRMSLRLHLYLGSPLSETRLRAEEAAVLATALRPLVIRGRTGQLGFMYGADRFVAAGPILRKSERELLDAVARKCGLTAGIRIDKS
jgi:hypothetical protein